MAHGGKRTGAGRPKGATNKNTKDLQAIAQRHSEEAIQVLVDIMKDEDNPATARISAAKIIIERGHGKTPNEQTSGDKPTELNQPRTLRVQYVAANGDVLEN